MLGLQAHVPPHLTDFVFEVLHTYFQPQVYFSLYRYHGHASWMHPVGPSEQFSDLAWKQGPNFVTGELI